MDLPLERPIFVGIVTDLHWNQMLATRSNRHYADSLDKLQEAVATFNRRRVDFAVNLGDTLDSISADSADLQQLLEVHARHDAPWIHVLGNHDADTCGKPVQRDMFVRTFGMPASYYSFYRYGLHWAVLDGNFAENGCDWASSWDHTWMGEAQIEWLRRTLEACPHSPTVLFVHQLVCPPGGRDEPEAGASLRDAERLREILESAGNVFAVFSGHHHPGDYQCIVRRREDEKVRQGENEKVRKREDEANERTRQGFVP